MAIQKKATLTCEEMRELLFRVLVRYDGYAAAANTKAAMVGAYCTFVLGTIVLRWSDLVLMYSTHRALAVTALCLSAAIAFSTCVSLWYLFAVVRPYLESSKKPGSYHSYLFFEHVAEHATPEAYLDHVESGDLPALRRDVSAQVHAIAVGLRQKYRSMRVAVNVIIFVQLPAIFVLAIVQAVAISFRFF